MFWVRSRVTVAVGQGVVGTACRPVETEAERVMTRVEVRVVLRRLVDVLTERLDDWTTGGGQGLVLVLGLVDVLKVEVVQGAGGAGFEVEQGTTGGLELEVEQGGGGLGLEVEQGTWGCALVEVLPGLGSCDMVLPELGSCVMEVLPELGSCEVEPLSELGAEVTVLSVAEDTSVTVVVVVGLGLTMMGSRQCSQPGSKMLMHSRKQSLRRAVAVVVVPGTLVTVVTTCVVLVVGGAGSPGGAGKSWTGSNHAGSSMMGPGVIGLGIGLGLNPGPNPGSKSGPRPGSKRWASARPEKTATAATETVTFMFVEGVWVELKRLCVIERTID